MEPIVYNINTLFEYLTFFYVIFHKGNRQPDKKRRVVIAICLFAWIGAVIAGTDLWNRLIGPFPAFVIWVYIVIWCLFDISAIEIVVLGIGQWLILSMLESALYIMLQPLQVEQFVLENASMLFLSCCLWIYYILAGKKHHIYAFELPIRIWCLLDAILAVLTGMISFFSYVIAQELSSSSMIFMGRILSSVGGVIIVVLLLIMTYFLILRITCADRMNWQKCKIKCKKNIFYNCWIGKRKQEDFGMILSTICLKYVITARIRIVYR